jgi:hypothetical protein
MPYSFIRSLAEGSPMRQALTALLPGGPIATTPLEVDLRDFIFNTECNLMLVPGWINQVMGTLVTGTGLPDHARFSAEAAEFVRQYMFKIEGYYDNAMNIVADKIATAAADPAAGVAFTTYCRAQFSRVSTFLSAPAAVWTGPALKVVEIGTDGKPIPTIPLLPGGGPQPLNKPSPVKDVDIDALNSKMNDLNINATEPAKPAEAPPATPSP